MNSKEETMLNDSRNERRPVAVVSGGSSGLGKSFVAALHRRNYVVITCARDASNLQSLETKYPGIMGHVADVSDRIAMHEFATKVLSTYPTVDLLISNAGGLHEIDFTRSDLQDVDLSTELGAN